MTKSFYYKGFSNPNGTIVPDEVFDVLLPELTDAELRVLLYIIRRTFGFKRNSDDISLRQMVEGITTKDGRVLDRGAGLSKAGAAKALKGLVAKGIIVAKRNSSPERGNEPTTYALRFENEPSLSTTWTRGGSPGRQALVHSVDTQQTVKQQTDINHSNLRKASPENERTDTEPAQEQGSGQTVVPPIAGSEDLQRPFAARGLAAIGEVLATKRRRSQRYDEDRQVIVDLLSDFRCEFNDQATLKQSVSRAYNLMQRSGMEIGTFTSKMYEARAITKEYSASITSILSGSKSISAKHKMAYWFSVLEDLCGLKPVDPSQSSPSG
jgi:Bacteriophage replication protein O